MKVYKYRGTQFLERDVRTLTEDKIFASPFDQLNDPFEGLFNDQISSLVTFIERTFKVDGTEVRERLKDVLDYKTKLGIYSLSKCFKNELLWAHYGNAHKGFCIEYELNGLKRNFLVPKTVNELDVDYKKLPQKVTPQDFKNQALLLKKLYATKSKEWKYEDEIRLVFDTFGPKKYHPSTLTGIYFGAEMKKVTRKFIIDSLTNRDVKFFEIKRIDGSFKLDRELIHENYRSLVNDLTQFDYFLLEHKEEWLVENFYIWFKDIDYNKKLLETFCEAFREKYAKKEKNNLFIFRDDSIRQLIQKYPLNDNEEKKFNDSLIAHSFLGDNGYCLIYYNEI